MWKSSITSVTNFSRMKVIMMMNIFVDAADTVAHLKSALDCV